MDYNAKRTDLGAPPGDRKKWLQHRGDVEAGHRGLSDTRLIGLGHSAQAAMLPAFAPITGTRGSVTLDPAYDYVEPITSLVRLGSKKRTRHFAKRDQFGAELVYFSDCVLKNREPEPDGEEGRIDIDIIEALHRSMKTGHWVNIPRSRRTKRPAPGQEIRRPPVPREPALVDVGPASR